jgi:hypothetical protein
MHRLIKKLSHPDTLLVGTLIALGLLNFGWIIYPELGAINIVMNAAIYAGILAVALIWRLMRKS